MKRSEHSDQVAIFQWAALQSGAYPELELLFAIPNGAAMKSKRHAVRMKAEGLKAGVPDMFLPVARGGYHGLWIEQKYNRNTPSDKQEWWLDRLHEQGYLAVVCYSTDESIKVIQEYLGI